MTDVLFDVLVKGGVVVDPATGARPTQTDIGVYDGRIAAMGNLSDTRAVKTLDATGLYVVPGLVDIHVHVFDAVTPIGVPADPNCIAKGVTTVVDAGSAGAHNYPGFKRYAIQQSVTTVRAMLNVSTLGMVAHSVSNKVSEVADFRHLPLEPAIQTIERNRDTIVGVKLRLMPDVEGGRDLDALALAREVADAVQLPLMLHYVNRPVAIGAILERLAPGDILTHCFHGHRNGVLEASGSVSDAVRAAVDRGVRLDVGHGWVSFSFETAEQALEDGLMPTTISTDLHHYCVTGPVFDLPTLMSKFMALGMTFEQVVECTTSAAAASLPFVDKIGTLGIGSVADIAVLELAQGKFLFTDCHRQTRSGSHLVRPVATVKHGAVYGTGTRTGLDL